MTGWNVYEIQPKLYYNEALGLWLPENTLFNAAALGIQVIEDPCDSDFMREIST